MWAYYYEQLSEGIAKGYNPVIEQYDNTLVTSLRKNIAQFSAFKETSFKRQLEAILTKDGKVQGWQDFKKLAKEIDIEYNQRWLKTEYDQTVANANAAENWKDYSNQKDVYANLKYMTIGDSRVREEHKEWHGTILPVEHPFWKTHLPPNNWGCRCYVVQTNDKVTKGVRDRKKLKEDFKNNPGNTGKIFAEPSYKKGMSAKDAKEATKNAKKWDAS